MTTTVGRIYRFRGVHSLPGFPEPWCFPHQHDYTVEVVVAGGTDTLALDVAWDQFGLDGRVVNMNAVFLPSTVESIAEELLEHFDALSVTVWEDQQRWGRAER
jgi:6-pyruvoyl-tetrahydropterin synthase